MTWRIILLAVLGGLLPNAAHAIKETSNAPVVVVKEIEDSSKTGLSDQLSRMIETEIERTNKFRVIEQRKGADLNPSARGVGAQADLYVYGYIASKGEAKKSDFFKAYGKRLKRCLITGCKNGDQVQECYTTEIEMRVDIKILDVRSGLARHTSPPRSERVKSTANCGKDTGIDASALLSEVARKAAVGLAKAIYPIRVAALQPDGAIMLNYGEGSIDKDSYLTIYKIGDPVIDPVTKDVIATNDVRKGVVQVIEVQARFSRARPVAPFTVPPVVGDTAREPTDEDQGLIPGTKRKKGRKESSDND